jgi:hypothetical protein
MGIEIMKAEKHTKAETEGSASKTLWAYAYEILPPQRNDVMKEIGALFLEEHVEAKREAHRWAGRMVREQRVTHILIVSDSPDQSRGVNRRLESQVERLKARYSLTAPMAVADDGPAHSPAKDRPPGTGPLKSGPL